jgi:lipopolysaccharide biosynthesis regulator YciM
MIEVENYADESDKATEQEENLRNSQVATIQAKVKQIPTSATCLNCGEGTANGARWCCPDCRDSWQMWNPEA